MKNYVVESYENYREEERLSTNNARRIEFITTVRALDELIVGKKKILDCAAGTGVYAFYLADKGHDVTATDITPRHIEVIREVVKDKPYKMDARVLDATDMSIFEDETFDVVLNMGPLLKKGGIFITEQVGGDNDRDLVEMVLPDTEKPFPHLNLRAQKKAFMDAGFHIERDEEAYRPIKFYDVGAFVWFAHIIEWEFPEFSVDRCFDSLLKMHKMIEDNGKLEGTIHRYLIVAKK